MKRLALALLGALVPVALLPEAAAQAPKLVAAAPKCPPEMVRVSEFCVDRWEASFVDRQTGRPLSPFYPPSRVLLEKAWQTWEVERHLVGDAAARAMPLPPVPDWQTRDFEPRAVSAPGVVPAGYVSQPFAKRACEAAGKRLCTEEEWVLACGGRRGTKFPYGATFERSKCNVYRYYHPAFILHGDSSIGHRDPRLNLLLERGTDPVLRVTGGTPACASIWPADQTEDRIFDMVGNLDEWVADDRGVFVGGFYARATTKGCKAKVTVHAPSYYDYSTGARCCRDLAAQASPPD